MSKTIKFDLKSLINFLEFPSLIFSPKRIVFPKYILDTILTRKQEKNVYTANTFFLFPFTCKSISIIGSRL